jgi:predicted RNA-binding protein YlxR (DUF448 family)
MRGGVAILSNSVHGDGAEGVNERMCIVTRERHSPDEMIRFVAGPGGEIVADLKRKLPGRGVWVTAARDRVNEAVKRQAFSRGLKATVVVPPDLATRVGDMLERDALQSLAMVNKAGQAVTGGAKVTAAIEAEAIVAILQARDGAPDGARKLRQALGRRFGDATARPQWVELFDSRQLDLALGRANVIHAALKTSAVSKAFLARCRRLAAYKGSPGELCTTDTSGTIDRAVLHDMAFGVRSDRDEITNGRGPGIENL